MLGRKISDTRVNTMRTHRTRKIMHQPCPNHSPGRLIQVPARHRQARTIIRCRRRCGRAKRLSGGHLAQHLARIPHNCCRPRHRFTRRRIKPEHQLNHRPGVLHPLCLNTRLRVRRTSNILRGRDRLMRGAWPKFNPHRYAQLCQRQHKRKRWGERLRIKNTFGTGLFRTFQLAACRVAPDTLHRLPSGCTQCPVFIVRHITHQHTRLPV